MSDLAKKNKLPHRTGRGGMALAHKRFARKDVDMRVKEKMDSGMSEHEARESTQPLTRAEIEKYELFLEARTLKKGGYDDNEETVELLKQLVSIITI